MDKSDETSVDRQEPSKSPIKPETISLIWLPLFVLPWILLYLLMLLNYQKLPSPILIENEAQYPHRFIAERAKRLNDELTGIGPRVVGSIENEELAIQLLEREVQQIIQSRNVIHNITYDIQKESGSFELDSMTSVYNGIQNFVVKFTPADRDPSHCLLINSHYDSVPISRGAGDAATMIVVMMEVLRVLSTSPTTFEHGIVFLFNGAEEVGLQGSHMFITKHKWAPDVRAVLNMDSAGTGGRECMFRTTADNYWMLKYYKQNAVHPTGTVLINELFDMKIIPSDSDFRIFRDYGDIPGLDFAIYRNGYVYHTQSDRPEKIPLGTYQNVGDNILSISKAIANAEELSDPKAHLAENPIYFDFLGWFMVSYSVTVSIVINVFVCLICVVGIFLSIWSHVKNFELSASMVSIQFGLAIIIQCVSIVIGAGVVLLLSIIYDACNRSMSYFSNPWILLGIYYCPLLFCLGLGCALHVTFLKKKEIHTHLYVQLYLHAQSVFYIILTLIMTAVGIRTIFTVTLTLAFYTFTMFINFFSKLQLKGSVWWTLIQFAGQVFPYMFLSYYTILTLEVFVPVQGRSGPSTNPDSIIAVTAILLGVLIGYLMPTFSLFKRPLIVLSGFLVVFVVFVIIIITPLGFPFQTDSQQRFWIFDTQRTFHHLNGTVRKADNGYFMLTMDRHMNEYVKDIVPGMNEAIPTEEECNTELFCGMPLYTTRMIAQSKKSFWIPHASTLHPLPVSTHMELKSRTERAANVQRLIFEVSGPDHMGLFISPKVGNQIVDWSILDVVQTNVPDWGDRLSYFVLLAHGGTNTPFEFYIDVQTSNTTDGIVDMAIVGQYTHYDELESDEFQAFVKSFPEWAQTTHWMSTFESWVF